MAGVFFLTVFLALALFGAEQGWRRPTLLAWAIAVVALVMMLLVLGARSTDGNEDTVFTPLGVLRLVLGAAIVVGGPAVVFNALHRRSIAVRAVSALLALILSLPLAFIVALLIACSGGGACI